jgi:TPR repeat protein
VAKVATPVFAAVAAVGVLVAATSGSPTGIVFASVGVVGTIVAVVLAVGGFRAQRRERLKTRGYDEPRRVEEALAGEGMYDLGVAPEDPEARAAVGLPARGHTPYLPRPAVDGKLRERLADAAKAPGETLIVVEGPAAAGKSRTLLEALKEVLPDAVLLNPTTSQALVDLGRDGPPAGLKSRACVLWLNDLERYAGHEGLNLTTLKRFGEWGRPVVVLAAYGGKAQLRSGDTDAEVAAGDLLRRYPPLHLDATMTARERELLETHADYARAADRIAAEGIAEFMIGALKLRHRLTLESDCPEGVAVVRAAIDWRRLKLLRPVTEEALEDLYTAYFDPATTENFERGLRWARKAVYSQVSLLKPVEGGYQPHDYAVRVDRERERPIAPAMWRAVVERYASREETLPLVREEGRESAVTDAVLQRFDSEGDASASYTLGRMLLDREKRDEAEEAFARAAERGHAEAAYWLGLMLLHKGDYDGAERAYRRSSELGGPLPEAAWEELRRKRAVEMHNTGVLRNQEGERDGADEGAEEAFRRADEIRDPP